MKYLFLLLLPFGAKAQLSKKLSDYPVYLSVGSARLNTDTVLYEYKIDTCLTEILVLQEGKIVNEQVYQVNKITHGMIPCPDATINYNCAAVHYGEIKSIIGYLDRNKKPLKPVQIWH